MRKKLPKGPFPLPIIGNYHQFIWAIYREKSMVKVLQKFQREYGNLFTIWLGPTPSVSIADFETAQEAMVKNGDKFPHRDSSGIFEDNRAGLGVFAANGHEWQVRRRFTLQTLRNFGLGKNMMEARIMEEVNSRFQSIERDAVNGETVRNIHNFLDITIGSLINSILFSKRFKEDDEEFKKLKRNLDASTENFSWFEVLMPLWIQKLKIFEKRQEKIFTPQKEALKYLNSYIVKRQEEIENGQRQVSDEPQDFLDAYLQKIRQEKEDGVKDSPFHLEDLRLTLLDLWITAQETTAATLNVAIMKMIFHPEVQKKDQYPYFNATIQEIHRHASILNLSFWRRNAEDTVVAGQPVAEGALVGVQLSLLHRDESVYKNWQEFNPSRFLENEKLNRMVIPFGVGKRACLGESMAQAEIYLIFGNLLLNYEIQAHGADPDPEELAPTCPFRVPKDYDFKLIKVT
ncbi:unnamed protein product [Caenorhabditis auriculariae]|uniref:Uncharacterized protein n=1 Tax=Caenorhabditis auriculariae TaxID=2777116 RepID=A0A8S1HE22_9PELO|nr:unnamed protein product [Caenorhabditis auriculariae]